MAQVPASQSNMFKMIRSARSCLTWEPGMDGGAVFIDGDATFESSEPSRRNSDVGLASYNSDGSLPSTERTLKRLGAARAKLGGVGRQRMTRAKTIGSENVAPPNGKAHPGSGDIKVLDDVTNKIQHSGNIVGAKQKQQPAAKAKPEPTPPTQGSVIECTSMSSTPEDIEIDTAHADDAQYCVEYVNDIYEKLRLDEALHLPHPGYMEIQGQVNSKMRAILVDWLVDVHRKYKLRSATLFLAVSLIDRFLEKCNTQRRRLQLVGVTGLLIAAKYEEVYPPQIHDFVYVTDKAYSKKEIIDMEVSILSALDFSICRPLPVTFLERYQQVNGCTEAHRDLAEYLLELTLTDYKMIKYSPSHLAAAAILLSNKLLQRRPSWTPAAIKHTKLTEAMLKECAKGMCGLLESVEFSQLQAVRKKYSQLKHHAVAKLNFANAPRTTPSAGASEAGPRRLSNGSAQRDFASGSVLGGGI